MEDEILDTKLKVAKREFEIMKKQTDKELKKIKYKKTKVVLIIAVIYIVLNLLISLLLNFTLFDSLIYCLFTLFLGIIILKASEILNYKDEEDKILLPLIQKKEYISKIKKDIKRSH